MIQFFKSIVVRILRAEAKAVIHRYKPKIILVTGSIGKTSTKDAVFAVLSKFYHVRKSEKSYNSEIGIPLSILGLETGWQNPFIWIKNFFSGALLLVRKNKAYPEWLVLEVGTRKPGDIKMSVGWLKADIVILTAIGTTPPHIEFYKSLQHLVEEKTSILSCLKKNGTLIINADDPIVFDIKNKTTAKVLSFGESDEATIRASHFSIHYTRATSAPEGLSFKVGIAGANFPVSMRWVFGKTHIYAALAALSVASLEKCDLVKASEALSAFEVSNGRLRLIEGINGSFIIDDTYNASPSAMDAALETLHTVKSEGRKIAVLGDMLELGKYTEEAHRRVGEVASKVADMLITVGIRSKFTYASANEHGMKKTALHHCPTAEEAATFLEKKIQKGDLILVKGSQAMRMERVVKKIMSHPELASRLLVRQEREWLNR